MKKKSQLSSFDILTLSKELANNLVGGFIDKVYQPTKKDIIIRFTVPNIVQAENHKEQDAAEHDDSTNGSKYKQIYLKIKLGKYLYMEYKSKDFVESSEDSKFGLDQKMGPPAAFAMLLRKHLRNGKIINISQHEFDRIIVIEVQKGETFHLIIELFGDGNVILVKDGMIIQPLLPQTWSYRTLRAGEEFKYPPARKNPRVINVDEFCDTIKTSSKDLVRTLIMDLDIPGKFAEELCHQLQVDKNSKANQLEDDLTSKLFENMRSLFQEIESSSGGYIVYNDQELTEPIDLIPIKLDIFSDLYFKEMNNYNSAAIEFFKPKKTAAAGATEIVQSKDIEDDTKRIEYERARLERQVEQQRIAIEKFSSEAELNHIVGETIYTNYQRCEAVISEINELRLNQKVDPNELLGHLNETTDIKELNLNKEYVILEVEGTEPQTKLEIKLNLRKSVIENANSYYERSKQAKEKLRGAQKAMETTQSSQKKINIKLKKTVSESTIKPRAKIVKHFWFEKYHWFISTNGNIIVAGRDAKSNDQVVKKYLKDNDRYCHADISGAASVVVKHNPDEKDISDDTLQQACEFAVVFSKAWNAKIGSSTAYWVKPDQVSKTPQTGEFLARGAFVIRGKRNHIGNIKLQIAIGEIKYNGHYKLMSGPLSSIQALSKAYVILAPGNIKKNIVAKELSKLFNISIDEILGLLPSGEFIVLEKVGLRNKKDD
jgi:predicted ribosome quality control (RQC) complex YloA/Tae2 family protein